MRQRPEKGSYSDYFKRYIELVPDGDLIAILTLQWEELHSKLAGLNEEMSLYRYAPGKWSVKEVLGHTIDAERVFTYRLLLAARNDRTPLLSFDQDRFIENASFDEQPFSELLEQLGSVRKSTLLLLRSFRESDLNRKGVVNGNEATALAWACVIAGHELHHRRVLEERYLPHV